MSPHESAQELVGIQLDLLALQQLQKVFPNLHSLVQKTL